MNSTPTYSFHFIVIRETIQLMEIYALNMRGYLYSKTFTFLKEEFQFEIELVEYFGPYKNALKKGYS